MIKAVVCHIIGVLVPLSLHAQAATPQERAVELYRAPISQDPVTPRYPSRAARTGQEGWVKLNFMVDGQGHPYEVHVADRVGDQSFVGAAQQALEATAFLPAMTGDRPVDGSATILYRFVMEDGSDSARRVFASRYRRFMRALQEESQADAAEELMRLEGAEIHNNYEYAYANMARYYFALRYGTPLEQMDYLDSALGESAAQPQYESFLPQDAATSARRALFQLRAQNSHFREALDTWTLMEANGDEEGLSIFRDTYEQILAFRITEEPYGIDGNLDENGSWHIGLFKDVFFLDRIVGHVTELKLRCQRGYVFFQFDPETQYEPADSGDCSLEVIGDPGTKFRLVQQ